MSLGSSKLWAYQYFIHFPVDFGKKNILSNNFSFVKWKFLNVPITKFFPTTSLSQSTIYHQFRLLHSICKWAWSKGSLKIVTWVVYLVKSLAVIACHFCYFRIITIYTVTRHDSVSIELDSWLEELLVCEMTCHKLLSASWCVWQPVQLPQHWCDVVTPTGVMWSHRRAPVTRRATASCTDYTTCNEVVLRWSRTAVSCSSPGDTRWTLGRATWWHSRTTTGLLVGASVASCSRSDRWPWHGPPATAHALWQHRGRKRCPRWRRKCRALGRCGTRPCPKADSSRATTAASLPCGSLVVLCNVTIQ